MSRVAGWGAAIALIGLSAWIVLFLYGLAQPPGIDFAPIWAAEPSIAYDAKAVTTAHPFPVATERPFAYPPTALLLFTPMRILPFKLAFALFTLAGFSLLCFAAIRAGCRWIAICPPILLMAFVGQASLVVGGLALLAFTLSDWRWRGLLLGVALSIKPQLFLLLPVALYLEKDWRTAAATALVFSTLAIFATAAFGPGIWTEWLGAIQELRRIVASTPWLADDTLGGKLAFAPISLALLWFARKGGPALRFAAMISGALLISPYAMSYELGLVLPGVALLAAAIVGAGFFLAPKLTLAFVVAALLVGRLWNVAQEPDDTGARELEASA